MTFPNRTSVAAATLAIVFLGAVVCPCPMPMAAAEPAHEHGCCPDETPETSIRAVGDDCCSNLPQIATAIVKKEREVSVLIAEAFDLEPVPTVALVNERPEKSPVPPAFPPLVLRI